MPQLMPKPKMCPGADCPGCSSANCYASGGEIKGVNKANPFNPSESEAGSKLRQSQSKHTLFPETKKREAKELHKQTLGELKMMPKPKLYARGGEVAADEDAPHIKGVHKSFLAKNDAGMSESGLRLRQGKDEEAKEFHKQTLSDMKSMPKPKLMAEGGKVGSGSRFKHLEHSLAHEKGIHDPAALAASIGRKKYGAEGMGKLSHHEHMAEGGEAEHEHEDHDDELHGMLGEELMDAFDSKDKKRMMDSIEAIVMRALSKE